MRYFNNFTALLSEVVRYLYSICDKIWHFVILAGSILLLVGVLSHVNIIKSLAVGILLLVSCFLICRRVYKNKVLPLLGMASLMLHFLISIIFNYVFKSFGADSVEYHYAAVGIAETLNSGAALSTIPIFKQYFTHFVAVIYYLFGTNRLMGTFIVSYFAVFAGVFIQLSCKTAGLRKSVGCFASVAVWFMPGFLFFTSDLLKDSVVLFLTALSFYLFALLIYKRNGRLKTVLLLLLLMTVVVADTAIRFYVFVPLIVGFGMSFLVYFFTKKEFKYKFFTGVIVVSLAILFAALSQRYMGGWLSMSVDKFFQSISATRQNEFAYASAGIKDYDISSLDKALKALPVLCAHYLMQPFPSSWLSEGSAFYIRLLIPDMIVWYVMLIFVAAGSYMFIKDRNLLGVAILGYLFIFLCSNGLLVGNVGSIYRYRLQFQLLAFVPAGNAAAGIWKRFSNRSQG